MSTQESTHKSRAEDAANRLTNAINEMSFDSVSFADVLANQHRTNQQTTSAALLTVLLRLAENDTDARNEQAVTYCRLIKDFLTDQTDLFVSASGQVRFAFI